MQRVRGIDRLGRGDEGAGLERRLAPEGLMEPDAEGTREFQAIQRGGVIAPCLMGRGIPGFSQGVEQVGDLLGDRPLEREAPQRLVEAVAVIPVGALARCNQFGQYLSELAQLDERRRWISPKITLGQGAQSVKARIMAR